MVEGDVQTDSKHASLRIRCETLLEQAITCSPFADVQFIFDDGCSELCAHRAMLCGASEVFKSMFENGMLEKTTGQVRVRGISRESFRGFLEWIYLGDPLLLPYIFSIDYSYTNTNVRGMYITGLCPEFFS